MNDLSSTCVSAAFEWLETHSNKPEAATFAGLTEEGVTRAHISIYCHAYLRSLSADHRYAVATAANWNEHAYSGYGGDTPASFRKKISPELGDRFYDWLVNYSFASPFIIAPSYEFARDKGFLLSGELPSNTLAAICTLGRTCYEHQGHVTRMFDIIDAVPGICPDLAFVVAFGVGAGYNGYQHSYGPLLGNHCIVKPGDVDYIKNFVEHRVVSANRSFRDCADYFGITNMWGETYGSVIRSLQELSKAEVKTERVVVPNPFAPVAPITGGLATIEEEVLVNELLPAVMPHLPNSGLKRKEPLRVAA